MDGWIGRTAVSDGTCRATAPPRCRPLNLWGLYRQQWVDSGQQQFSRQVLAVEKTCHPHHPVRATQYLLRSSLQRIPHHFRHILSQTLDGGDAFQRGTRMRLPPDVELPPAVEAARNS